MITKLQLKATEHCKEQGPFKEGKIYSAVCQDDLLTIDCDGTVVIEFISESTKRKFDVISSVDEVVNTELTLGELYGETQVPPVERFVPFLISS